MMEAAVIQDSKTRNIHLQLSFSCNFFLFLCIPSKPLQKCCSELWSFCSFLMVWPWTWVPELVPIWPPQGIDQGGFLWMGLVPCLKMWKPQAWDLVFLFGSSDNKENCPCLESQQIVPDWAAAAIWRLWQPLPLPPGNRTRGNGLTFGPGQV